MTDGHIDETARFPGAMEFADEKGIPKKLFVFGIEKSFIPLLSIIPVVCDVTPAPKLKQFVLANT
jgi:hypothetical protein